MGEGVWKGIIIIFQYLECCRNDVELDMLCEAFGENVRIESQR